jgi:acyl-CoA synthetase (AMP-forming)/AMP-acid ligase II
LTKTETLPEIAARHARERGNRLAFTFLTEGIHPERSLTFAELDSAARSVAARLAATAEPGERALLVYEAGLDFVTALLGCFYAGLTAVPVPAPELSRLRAGIPRIEAVVRDCNPVLLCGNTRTLEILGNSRADLSSAPSWLDTRGRLDTTESEGAGIPRVASGTEESSEAPSRPPERRLQPQLAAPQVAPGFAESLNAAPAYLQYTSGSTNSPRGVMIGHENLTGHLAGMAQGLGYSSSSVSVCWMPHFHDYGLVEGILLPLFNGTPSYLMSPFAFLKRPASWLEAISRFRGTHTQAFNYAWRHCVQRVKPEQRPGLDLSCLESFGNGGEPIRPDTPEDFYRTFAECGLRREALAPVFGLAEATLLVTASPVGQAPVVTQFQGMPLVSCGPPLPETEVAIVDPETLRRAEPETAGEIWVSAPGVAQGYYGCPEESERVFRARIQGESGTWLRTGDLGFLREGQLYVSGRLKDLIIIHGANHYPQDIEWTVQGAHPLLRADHGAAFSVEVAGEERLCIVQEIERGELSQEDRAAVVNAVTLALGERHGLTLHRAVFIRRASIPKTTSGKIQRRACRQGLEEGSLRTVFAWPEPVEEHA